MPDTEKKAATPDPFMAALETELGEYAAALDGLTDDERFLWSIARSLSNRYAEIADLKGQIDVAKRRIVAVQNNIAHIEQWRMREIRQAVTGMLKIRTGPRCQSVKVPGMQFGTKDVPAKIEWYSEFTPELVTWAETNCPDAVSYSEPTTPAPKIDKDGKALLLAYRLRTGRTPQHCTYTPGGNAVYARPLKGKDDGKDDA